MGFEWELTMAPAPHVFDSQRGGGVLTAGTRHLPCLGRLSGEDEDRGGPLPQGRNAEARHWNWPGRSASAVPPRLSRPCPAGWRPDWSHSIDIWWEVVFPTGIARARKPGWGARFHHGKAVSVPSFSSLLATSCSHENASVRMTMESKRVEDSHTPHSHTLSVAKKNGGDTDPVTHGHE